MRTLAMVSLLSVGLPGGSDVAPRGESLTQGGGGGYIRIDKMRWGKVLNP
jgi:hypothetical protein